MSNSTWRGHAKALFDCEKQSAIGTRGMVVANHPLASAAGAEMLAAGGNAIDVACATSCKPRLLHAYLQHNAGLPGN